MAEIYDETSDVLDEEVKPRQNHFCVIAKEPWANGRRDLQTNSAWEENPYGDAYAVVPDDMVPSMIETQGYLDELTLSEDGTEVVSFVPGEIPVIEPVEPEAETETTVWDELDAAYQEGVNTAYDQ